MTIENNTPKGSKFIYVQQLNRLKTIIFYGMHKESDVMKDGDDVIGVWRIKESTQN